VHRIRVHAVVVAATLLLSSAASCSKPGGTGGGTQPSSAEVRWPDAGGPELVVSGRTVALPTSDLAPNARPQVMQDDAGKRLAFATTAGDARVVYQVGDQWFVGPKTKMPIDMRSAPDLDHAYGPMFEVAGSERRAALLAEVKRASGEAGVVKLLASAAYVDAREWDDAYAGLPAPRQAEVKQYLDALLSKGAPTAGLRRAVVLVPLRDPARAPALGARVRELVDPVREPRASAAMIRALAAMDAEAAAKLGCEVLAKNPLDTANAKGTPEAIDAPGREALVDAAAFAVARGAVVIGPAATCKEAEALLGDDLCYPWFRCGPGGPLTGRETTKQDEPLCTRAIARRRRRDHGGPAPAVLRLRDPRRRRPRPGKARRGARAAALRDRAAEGPVVRERRAHARHAVSLRRGDDARSSVPARGRAHPRRPVQVRRRRQAEEDLGGRRVTAALSARRGRPRGRRRARRRSRASSRRASSSPPAAPRRRRAIASSSPRARRASSASRP
jgi:hypothetical protein